MAEIMAVIRLSGPVPRATMEAMVQNIKLSGRIVLDSPVAVGLEANVLGVVKHVHEPLMPFFTGEAE
jgi:hypothetical protein